jgi:hypothetical protein
VDGFDFFQATSRFDVAPDHVIDALRGGHSRKESDDGNGKNCLYDSEHRGVLLPKMRNSSTCFTEPPQRRAGFRVRLQEIGFSCVRDT